MRQGALAAAAFKFTPAKHAGAARNLILVLPAGRCVLRQITFDGIS